MLFFLFLFFFFTKLDQMSRVGSRGRHPKCRPKNHIFLYLLLMCTYMQLHCPHFLGLSLLISNHKEGWFECLMGEEEDITVG